ncbi:response regulator [Roseateles sp.]|uniref:response regulator n=1 Tax=Roseateles sp. TaxID=1971397 RepID=UPI0032657BA5
MSLDAPPELKLLVVDDDLDSAESLAFCLQLEGRSVQYATCGEDALKLAETFTPDVALIDIFMPEVDGHALAAELRKRFGTKIVVVAVTGALKSVELDAFDAHLMKPINFSQLDALLTQHHGGT